MAEVALSVTVTASPPSSQAPAGNGDSATAKVSGPFAALLASASGAKTSSNAPAAPAKADADAAPPADPAVSAAAIQVGTPETATPSPFSAAEISVLEEAVAALRTNDAKSPATPATIVPAATAPTGTAPEPLPVDDDLPAPSAKKEDGKKSESDSDKSDSDPLADAIASGANAVLAFAPVIAAPIAVTPPPAVVPVKVDAPITAVAATKVQTISAVSPRISGFNAGGDPAPAEPATTPAQSQAVRDQAVQDQAAQSRDSRPSPQSDSGAPRPQAPATTAGAAETPVSPDVAKAVIAALQQSNATTETPAKSDSAPAAPPSPAAAEADKAVRPIQQQAQPQALPVQTPVRHRGTEIAAPRRAGEARKRTETAAFDSAPMGLNQRAAEANPNTVGATAPGAIQGKGDAIVQQTLTIARDGAWLDKLAQEIAGAAGSSGDLQFKLNPQHLGSLMVAIRQSDDGASIRMTADNDTTRNILHDAQPRLMAEARAQGLRISDTHVDLNQNQNRDHNPSQNRNDNQSTNQDASRWTQGNANQQAGAQNGQNRQSSPAHQPFVSNLGRKAEAGSESPSGDSDALYA